MRKLLLTTAAVAAAIAGAVAGETAFGTFTDTRDGQTYKTVKIGTQTWMARNINYRTDSSWCYDNNADNCKRYGRLYDWKTATTICPNGWKLPSREDWKSLVATIGGEEIEGKKLKSKNGWKWNEYENVSGNGTDDYGFSALPGGNRHINGSFHFAGFTGYWHSATENNHCCTEVGSSGCAIIWIMFNNSDRLGRDILDKSVARSVRCVADRP